MTGYTVKPNGLIVTPTGSAVTISGARALLGETLRQAERDADDASLFRLAMAQALAIGRAIRVAKGLTTGPPPVAVAWLLGDRKPPRRPL